MGLGLLIILQTYFLFRGMHALGSACSVLSLVKGFITMSVDIKLFKHAHFSGNQP